MRPSKRSEVLDAALRVIGVNGLAGLTYESLAHETGMSKGGLLYHFPSRDALLDGVLAHIIEKWHVETAGRLPTTLDASTARDRLVAHIGTTMGDNVDLTELAVLVDLLREPARRQAYRDSLTRWLGAEAELGTDQRIAHLAAEGLWLEESLGVSTLSAADRRSLVDRLILLARDGAGAP